MVLDKRAELELMYSKHIALLKPTFAYSNPFDDVKENLKSTVGEVSELSSLFLVTKHIENVVPPKVLNYVIAKIYNCPNSKNYRSIFK
jgi:hypothetical protein